MAIATFNYSVWSARYPELVPFVSADLGTALFAEAGLYLDNSDCSPVPDVTVRGMLLNMLVAHIGKLTQTELVGRVSNASEGSVSVASEMNTPGSAAWFEQTPYGAAFWQATAVLRTMHYVPGRQPYFGDIPFGRTATLGYDPSAYGGLGWPF